MKIYYLSASPLPSTEANCVNVMRMCSAFGRAGHEVTLFARRNGGEVGPNLLRDYGVSEGLAMHVLGQPGRLAHRKLAYPMSVLRVLRRLPRPDLFYGRDIYSTAWVAQAHPDVPVAFETHEAPPTRLRRALERWLFRRRSFTTAFVISDALLDEYRAMHPAVDLVLARDAADEPKDGLVPAEVGGRPGARRVGYTGHLYPGKGMEIIAALAQRCPGVDFHVVGGRRADLREWRARTAHLSNIIYHGFVEHTRVAGYMAAMDVLLAPAQPVTHASSGRDIGRWMSPLKVFEYMAAGRPIIASAIPAIGEILRDGDTALLAPPQDLDAWVAALARLQDPALGARLAAKARAELLARHTWTARAGAIARHLAGRIEVVAPRAAAPAGGSAGEG